MSGQLSARKGRPRDSAPSGASPPDPSEEIRPLLVQADLYGEDLPSDRMCDWDEAEYAEYLLWVEAAQIRARAAMESPVRESARREPPPLVVQPIAVEA